MDAGRFSVAEKLIFMILAKSASMLEIGSLHMSNPIAVVSSSPLAEVAFGSTAPSLVILDGLDLESTPLQRIEEMAEDIFSKLSAGSTAVGLSVHFSSMDNLLEAAGFARRKGHLLELDLRSYRTINVDGLRAVIRKIKASGVSLSIRLRPDMIDPKAVNDLGQAGLDMIHLELSGGRSGPDYIRRLSDAGAPHIMARADVGDFDSAIALLSMGADMISLNGSADQDFVGWLSGAMREYDMLSGWYNAPKHICSRGDLRGLAFCCPPVKSCPVLGALKRAGMTPEQFVEKKVALSRRTPLEGGEGTCFGSLVWCCKISKPCFMRDAALRRAGLSGRDYMRLKRKLATDLLHV